MKYGVRRRLRDRHALGASRDVRSRIMWNVAATPEGSEPVVRERGVGDGEGREYCA